jgi:hypothetical protein
MTTRITFRADGAVRSIDALNDPVKANGVGVMESFNREQVQER